MGRPRSVLDHIEYVCDLDALFRFVTYLTEKDLKKLEAHQFNDEKYCHRFINALSEEQIGHIRPDVLSDFGKRAFSSLKPEHIVHLKLTSYNKIPDSMLQYLNLHATITLIGTRAKELNIEQIAALNPKIKTLGITLKEEKLPLIVRMAFAHEGVRVIEVEENVEGGSPPINSNTDKIVESVNSKITDIEVPVEKVPSPTNQLITLAQMRVEDIVQAGLLPSPTSKPQILSTPYTIQTPTKHTQIQNNPTSLDPEISAPQPKTAKNPEIQRVRKARNTLFIASGALILSGLALEIGFAIAKTQQKSPRDLPIINQSLYPLIIIGGALLVLGIALCVFGFKTHKNLAKLQLDESRIQEALHINVTP